jgi:hypothetical protein
MYLTRREKEAIMAAIAGAVLFGGIFLYGGVELYNFNKEQTRTMTAEAGFDVVDVKDAELSQVNEDFKAIIKCTHKETKQPIVIEYKLTSTDFIVMNQPESNAWDYLSMYIIPNQDPSFVGTVEEYSVYKNQQSNKNSSQPGENN